MKSILLRDDQCDLVAASLRFLNAQINEGICSAAHKVAGRYTNRRIAEILPLFEEPQEPAK